MENRLIPERTNLTSWVIHVNSRTQKYDSLAIERLGPDCSKLLDHAKQQELYKKNNHPNQEFNRGLSYSTVVEVGEQLFSALKYMHQKEIIHRDIKPQNILAGRGEDRIRNIFLVDFGVSKRFKKEVAQESDYLSLTA